MNLKDKKINFLGDSITEGVGASEEKYNYVNQVAELSGAVCRNYGVGGTRIAKQEIPSPEAKWDDDFLSRAERMDPDADVVVVFGGTNDFGHGFAPIGKMEDRTSYTFYGALHCLFTYLLDKYPMAEIVVITPLHRLNETNPKGDGWKPEATGVLKEYVTALREVTEYYSLPTLDLYSCSGIQPAVPVIQKMYLPDGLHPSDAGHRRIAEKLVVFMENLSR